MQADLSLCHQDEVFGLQLLLSNNQFVVHLCAWHIVWCNAETVLNWILLVPWV